jgi:hypothetical protein
VQKIYDYDIGGSQVLGDDVEIWLSPPTSSTGSPTFQLDCCPKSQPFGEGEMLKWEHCVAKLIEWHGIAEQNSWISISKRLETTSLQSVTFQFKRDSKGASQFFVENDGKLSAALSHKGILCLQKALASRVQILKGISDSERLQRNSQKEADELLR